MGGVYHKIHLVTFLYIFLLVDCFKWALIDRIEKRRVHSELCQFQTRGVYHKIHLVTFLYIFLLVDCFKWALTDCKIHLVTFLYIFLLVVKFDNWGGVLKDSPGDISLYLPISWLFQMSSHSLHWKAKSSLWALPVSNWGGVYCKIHLVSFLYKFLLVECFKWALIDRIEKQRVHSELCQFQTGGYIIRFTWWHFFISSY